MTTLNSFSLHQKQYVLCLTYDRGWCESLFSLPLILRKKKIFNDYDNDVNDDNDNDLNDGHDDYDEIIILMIMITTN